MQARNHKGEATLTCDFTVMDAEQRERYRALRHRLSEDLHEARELEDGYAFRHSSDAEVLIAMAEYITLERLCCPFFDFAIEVGRDGGEVWLKMTGGQEAKRILQAAQGYDQDSKYLKDTLKWYRSGVNRLLVAHREFPIVRTVLSRLDKKSGRANSNR